MNELQKREELRKHREEQEQRRQENRQFAKKYEDEVKQMLNHLGTVWTGEDEFSNYANPMEERRRYAVYLNPDDGWQKLGIWYGTARYAHLLDFWYRDRSSFMEYDILGAFATITIISTSFPQLVEDCYFSISVLDEECSIFDVIHQSQCFDQIDEARVWLNSLSEYFAGK